MAGWARAAVRPLTRSFLARFLLALGMVVTLMPALSRWEEGLREPVARAVAGGAWLTGLGVTALEDHVLRFDVAAAAFSYQIVAECIGLAMTAVLCAAVLAARAPWPRRIVGVLAAVAFAAAINVARLVLLAHVGVTAPAWFAFVHDLAWPVVQIGVVVGGWHLWLRWGVGHAMPSSGRALRVAMGTVSGATALIAMGVLSPLADFYDSIVGVGVWAFSRIAYSGRVQVAVITDDGAMGLFGAASARYVTAAFLMAAFLAVAPAGRRTPRKALRALTTIMAVQFLAACTTLAIGVITVPPEGGIGIPPTAWQQAVTMAEFGALGLLFLYWVLPGRLSGINARAAPGSLVSPKVMLPNNKAMWKASKRRGDNCEQTTID